jgi:hypothetical protein
MLLASWLMFYNIQISNVVYLFYKNGCFFYIFSDYGFNNTMSVDMTVKEWWLRVYTGNYSYLHRT